MPASDVEEFFDGKREESGSASESPSAEPAKPDEGAKPEPVAAAKQEAPEASADQDEEKEEPLPKDFEGVMKALTAVRGDRRRDRKKWREAERALIEDREKERRERARLEGELTAMRQHAIAAQQPRQAKEPETQDPEEVFWTKGPAAFMAEREQKLMQQFDQRLQTIQRSDFERERQRMRRQHEDFSEAEAVFLEHANADRSWFDKAAASGDPLDYIYNNGREMKRLKDYGEVSSITELEAKIRQKIEAERSHPSETQPSARPPIPSKSIAGARGASVGVNREWSGPRPAESFFTGPRI